MAMHPPFFRLVNVPTVQAVFGANPMAVFEFGKADEDVIKANGGVYATFQTVNGFPENNLSDRPTMDDWTIQVDVFGRTSEEAELGAKVLRDAVELDAHVSRFLPQGKDEPTKKYRYSFDVDFLTAR